MFAIDPFRKREAKEMHYDSPNEMGEALLTPQLMTGKCHFRNDYSLWLKRGRQRSAVARVLRKPMTASESAPQHN